MNDVPVPPTANDNSEAWKAYWIAIGQPWRREPLINRNRQYFHMRVRGHYRNVVLDRADLEWLGAQGDNSYRGLRANNNGPSCYLVRLIEANLSGFDLSGIDLRLIQFSKTDFSRANLSGTNLTEAKFTSCKLEDANLSHAIAVHAAFDWANLAHANMAGINLKKACLWRAYLRGANLTGANLRSTDLRFTNVSAAKLNNAKLDGALVYGATPGIDHGGQDGDNKCWNHGGNGELSGDSLSRVVVPLSDKPRARFWTGVSDPLDPPRHFLERTVKTEPT